MSLIDILLNVILAPVFQFMMFLWDVAQLYMFIQWTLEIQQKCKRIMHWTVWIYYVTIILAKIEIYNTILIIIKTFFRYTMFLVKEYIFSVSILSAEKQTILIKVIIPVRLNI